MEQNNINPIMGDASKQSVNSFSGNSKRKVPKAVTVAVIALVALLGGTLVFNSFATTTTVNGLQATYYNNKDFTGTTVTRTDNQINFDWGTGNPATGIDADTFSVRWLGKVIAPQTGRYAFYTNSDDGVRVWVNNEMVVNTWTDHSAKLDSGTIDLTQGTQYDIKVEYYENAGSAKLVLSWVTPDGVESTITSANYRSTVTNNTNNTSTNPVTPGVISAITSRELPAAEGSGMVASRQYPGVFWWHRDGGDATADKPRDAVYALKFDNSGNLQPVRDGDYFPFNMVSGGNNVNWEDIALDNNNNLWIGDIGANNCDRNNQTLYKVREPNPSAGGSVSVIARYTFRFPDPAAGCNTWNSEAMTWLDGSLYIVAKNSSSTIYKISLPSGTTGTATLTRIGSITGASNISGISFSDDKKRMMVFGHRTMKVYTTNNTSLTGDAYVRDIIGRAPTYNADFDCMCDTDNATAEGGTFVRNSYNTAFVSEGKQIYFGVPAAYGDR